MKNSFSLNCRKQNCVRMRYKRSSRISRHFVSPNFGSFGGKTEFFNSHRRLHSNSDCFRFSSHWSVRMMSVMGIFRQLIQSQLHQRLRQHRNTASTQGKPPFRPRAEGGAPHVRSYEPHFASYPSSAVDGLLHLNLHAHPRVNATLKIVRTLGQASDQ